MGKDINLKYIGYARKSSEDNKERQAASLPEQLYALEGIKVKHNLKVVQTLEEAQSAHKLGREKFALMLKKVERGEANAILTWHLNRLARNMVDGGYIIQLMDEGKLIEIRTPSRSYRNSPDDKFMLVLEFGMSKKDSDDKSIVVERGLEKKARDGWRPGVAPVGYLNDKVTESGYRRIFTDPKRFPFVKKIFELFHQDIPVVEIHRIAKDMWHFTTKQKKRSGGKPLSISMIYGILTNPFYYGRFEYPLRSGKWYEGRHEKALTEDIFNEIQIKLGRRSRYKLKHHENTYSALMRCGFCSSGIVAEQKRQCICTNCKLKFSITKKNRSKCTGCGMLIEDMTRPTILHYIYYRCGKKKNHACTERAVRIDRLEQQIDEKLSKLEISPLFLDWAIKQINKMNENELNFREDTLSGIKRAHNACRMKLDNLLRLKISPENSDGSLLSDEQYKQQKIPLEVELKELEKQLADVDERMIRANDDTVRAFNFAATAREKFAQGDSRTKRNIFMGLGLHLTLKNKLVRFDSPKYIQDLEEMKKEVPIIGDRVAPKKEVEMKPKMDVLYASIPTLLRG